MRIRNVQPKVFQNYELDDAEAQSGQPIFKTLVGLWCHADSEGRFVWDPRKLQALIFPYRQVEIDQILNVLLEQDIVRKYTVEDVEYGWLVTFKDYQYISKKEPRSILPAPSLECYEKAPRAFPVRSMVLSTKEEGRSTQLANHLETEEAR